MRKASKIMALITALVCFMAIVAGCSKPVASSQTESKAQTTESKEENPYAEKLAITAISLDAPENFKNFPLVKEGCEKFNIDLTIQHVAWDTWDDNIRTLVATDSLPNVVAWYSFNSYPEYLDWVKQGVFKEIPDLSEYSELKKISESYSIFDKTKVDGKMYILPKVTFNNPFNQIDCTGFIYRRDWAKAIGKDFTSVQEITYDDFKAYLKEIQDKDPGKLGDKLVPLEIGGRSWGDMVSYIAPYAQNFYKSGDKYVWGFEEKATLDAIKEVKELYDAKFLPQDGFADGFESSDARFDAGRGATRLQFSNYSILMDRARNLSAAVDGFKTEDIGIFLVTQNGKVTSKQQDEYWAASAFASKCPDNIQSRWLALGNWLLEEEQVEKYAYGEKDVDWTKDANGKVTLNYEESDLVEGKDKFYISEQRKFQKFFVLEGMNAWLEGNPGIDTYVQQTLLKDRLERQEKIANFIATDYDLQFFSAENYDQYASTVTETGLADVIIEAIVSSNPEQVWKTFIDNNRTNVDAILAELNK